MNVLLNFFFITFRTTRLASFPDYLIIQLKKFMLREDWVPIKLDVSIEMPNTLDISPLRGAGPQPEEELLPEPEIQPPAPVMDQNVLSQLAEMGESTFLKEKNMCLILYLNFFEI